MKGSHAPSLRTIVARTLRDEIDLEPGTKILCACSGGPDSNAMLHALALLRARHRFDLVAHGVDHGLRPEAAAELAVARDVAASVDVPFRTTTVTVEPGGNLQARARTARYAALRAAAAEAGARFIATAHTLDDRAETVLLRILRGSGARGLAVLPACEGDLVRPIVRAARKDVRRHLERHRVPFASDPSNLDTRYARVRVRLEVLPLLESLSPRIADHLAALADDLAVLRSAPDRLTGLGRRQRDQVKRALAVGRTARIRVGECKEVLVRLEQGATVVTEVATAVAPRRKRPNVS